MSVLAASGLILATASGFSSLKPITTAAPTGTWTTSDGWNYEAADNPLDAVGGSFMQSMNGQLNYPLAFTSEYSSAADLPGLATKWSQTGNTVDIWLRANARWSNGAPVSNQDVIDSIEINAYLVNDGVGVNLGPISVIGPHELQIKEVGSNRYFLPYLLGYSYVYSAQQFGKYLPKNIAAIYAKAQSTNAKISTPATDQLSKAFQKMEGLHVPTITNGPYEIAQLTPSEAKLTVNPYFWAKKKVEDSFPTRIELNVSSSSAEWALMAANKLTDVYQPSPLLIIREWLKSKGHLLVRSPGYGQTTFAMNPDVYPFNMQDVRQAIAYLIQRQAVTDIGDPVIGEAFVKPDGVFDKWTLDKYLTAAQLNTLNSYNYNPAKATELLKASGFKKVGKTWMMPNGKPFSFTIYAGSGSTDWDADAEAIAGELDSFGIQASASMANTTVFSENVPKAKGYAAFMQWGGGSNSAYYGATSFAGYTGETVSGQGVLTPTKGDFNLGPLDGNYKLADGQIVNVPKDIAALATASPAEKNKLVLQLAQAGNQSVLELSLFNYVGEEFINAQDVTGWPASMGPWSYYGSGGSLPWIGEGWMKVRKTPVTGTCNMSMSIRALSTGNWLGCPAGGIDYTKPLQ